MTGKWGSQDINSGRIQGHRQFCLPFVYSPHPEAFDALIFHFWMLEQARKGSHGNFTGGENVTQKTKDILKGSRM